MLFKGKTESERRAQSDDWHRFFALLPVPVKTNPDGSDTFAWLQWVERSVTGSWFRKTYFYRMPGSTEMGCHIGEENW